MRSGFWSYWTSRNTKVRSTCSCSSSKWTTTCLLFWAVIVQACLFLVYFSFLDQPNATTIQDQRRDQMLGFSNSNTTQNRKQLPRGAAAPLSEGSSRRPTVFAANETPRILLVHVGKTGGETLKRALRIGCSVRKSRVHKQHCWHEFEKQYATATGAKEPFLSQRVSGYFHYRNIHPVDAVNQSTHFLFTVRHPLSRIRSWFRYISPLNCQGHEKAARTTKQQRLREGTPLNCRIRQTILNNKQSWDANFFHCFPTLSYLVQALATKMGVDNRTTILPQCQPALDDFWTSRPDQYKGSQSILGHWMMNYEYYVSRTIQSRPHVRVFAIRTESLWDDILDLEKFLTEQNHGSTMPVTHSGSDRQTSRFDVNRGMQITHHTSPSKLVDDALLSPAASLRMCCFLKKEINIYRDILLRAVNLNPSSRNSTLTSVVTICNADSWSAFHEQCKTLES